MDLVIFDCDGVLVDSEIISARMLRAEAASHGVDISIDHILDNYVGRSYPTVLAEIQAQFAIKLPDDFEDRYRALLLAAFEKDLQIMPDVRDVLNRLNTPVLRGNQLYPQTGGVLVKTGWVGGCVSRADFHRFAGSTRQTRPRFVSAGGANYGGCTAGLSCDRRQHFGRTGRQRRPHANRAFHRRQSYKGTKQTRQGRGLSLIHSPIFTRDSHN